MILFSASFLKKCGLIVLMHIGLIGIATAQNRLWVQAPSVAVCSDTITIQVYASFAVPIFGIQYSLQWDTSQLQYVEHTEIDLVSTPPGINALQVDTGRFAYAWVSFGGTADLDSTLLLEIRLLVRDGSGAAVVALTDFPVGIVATDIAFNSLTPPATMTIAPATIALLDPLGVCGVQKATVSGTLRRPDGAGVEGATLALVYQYPNLPSVMLQRKSASDGAFSFTEAIPNGVQYDLVPSFDRDPLNGVTTYDLILINRHILNVQPITDPYLLIAADADASNTITTMDVLNFRRLMLGIYTDLPGNTSWRFIDKAQTFTNPSNPFISVPFRESFEDILVQNNQIVHDFIGVKIGDINNSAIANNLTTIDDRNEETTYLQAPTKSVKKGEVFETTFQTNEAVDGCQFVLHIPGVEYVGVQNGTTTATAEFVYHADEQALYISWDGPNQVFSFTLQAKARFDGAIEDLIEIDALNRLAPEAYQLSATQVIHPLALRFDPIQDISDASQMPLLTVSAIQPNPWRDQVQVFFGLKAASDVAFEVFDATGMLVFQKIQYFEAGEHVAPIEAKDVPSKGVLSLRIRTSSMTKVYRIIKI